MSEVLRLPSCLSLVSVTHEHLALFLTQDEGAVVLTELMSLLGPPKKSWSKGTGCLSPECVLRRGLKNMKCRAKEPQVSRLPRLQGSGWSPRSESACARGST